MTTERERERGNTLYLVLPFRCLCAVPCAAFPCGLAAQLPSQTAVAFNTELDGTEQLPPYVRDCVVLRKRMGGEIAKLNFQLQPHPQVRQHLNGPLF
eukprot:SAG22_NODE_1046_length_5865_cov_4.719910_3_plen_97_part_00